MVGKRDLPPEVHQPSFLRGDESDAQLVFKFEWDEDIEIQRRSYILYFL